MPVVNQVSNKVVISQPMYFPWIGILEQVRLADVFVFYDDVQFTKGFFNRVQIKTINGIRWMTIPLRDHHRGQCINELEVDERIDWRSQHRDILRQAYLKSPFRDEALALVDDVFSLNSCMLADISRASILALANYFSLTEGTKFINSADIGVSGASSQRLRDLCLALKADVYITGHGAKNYLDHEMFEQSKIKVEYMEYRCKPYLQQHGEYTPYVTALDLVANCGNKGLDYIRSESVYWRRFLNGQS